MGNQLPLGAFIVASFAFQYRFTCASVTFNAFSSISVLSFFLLCACCRIANAAGLTSCSTSLGIFVDVGRTSSVSGVGDATSLGGDVVAEINAAAFAAAALEAGV